MPGQGSRPGAGTLRSNWKPVGNGCLPTFTVLNPLSPGGWPEPSHFRHTEKGQGFELTAEKK